MGAFIMDRKVALHDVVESVLRPRKVNGKCVKHGGFNRAWRGRFCVGDAIYQRTNRNQSDKDQDSSTDEPQESSLLLDNCATLGARVGFCADIVPALLTFLQRHWPLLKRQRVYRLVIPYC